MHNDKFVKVINKHTSYNAGETIISIPIINYHNIDNRTASAYATITHLFNAEMKYLHDNNFEVVPMSDVRYNETSNFLCVKEN